MKRGLKITAIIAAVLFVIVGLWAVDNFYYPFKSESPNYADVEKAFARLQFPADWKEVNSSENKGLFGRGCDPLNDSGCFHKSKTFSIPESTTIEEVKKVVADSGLCTGLVVSQPLYKQEAKPTNNYECGVGNGVKIDGTFRGLRGEVYLAVSTD